MYPMKFSVLWSPKFLACASLKNYGKNEENFPEFLKYDAKHWAAVIHETFFWWITSNGRVVSGDLIH
jgi:hypothetical protein